MDCPARRKTLSGLAKEIGDRTHSRAAVRIVVGFMVADSLRWLARCAHSYAEMAVKLT